MISDDEFFKLVKTMQEYPLWVYEPGEIGVMHYLASVRVREALGILKESDSAQRTVILLKELAQLNESLKAVERTALDVLLQALSVHPWWELQRSFIIFSFLKTNGVSIY